MTIEELAVILAAGESRTVEFKKSTTDITKDVYETVCSFSNRDGGDIFLGIKDDGTVLGVDLSRADKIKKDFVTSINNTQKMFPALYLQPEDIQYDGKLILHIHVPESPQVCRCSGRIYDRNHDSDVDITDVEDLVYKLYARKRGSYFVNKIYPGIGLEVLRSDLIDRARQMSRSRNSEHPWLTMSDEEILRSSGLILEDYDKREEGITLAAILLFGKDTTIMSALPQHKTDAIYRVENLDRYDDRDVIITNLFETYDRLMAFAKKHLNDPFILEGVQAVSARDHILREIFSNSLAHRDYATGEVATFVIERDQMYTENGNRPHGWGPLDPSRLKPFSKNPPIAKVFREVSLADELGSGMRNTYKYTKLYSGGTPQFIEGNFFTTIIPLSSVSTFKVGPTPQVTPQDTPQVTPQDKILEFCKTEKSKAEIMQYCGLKDSKNFTVKYLKPLLMSGRLKMTVPNKPTSRSQKYITAE
ncbi:MAG: putative DNA binding domain-containing protein [Oscillospiraceae bacterium]|nr:putative DNA binding domain-containing protein [Oscillospiraceae bacterium]